MGKVLAMLKGGAHIGGRKKSPLFNRGGGVRKVLPCLEGGGGEGTKGFRPAIFQFCSAPLPVINDQSLRVGYSGCDNCKTAKVRVGTLGQLPLVHDIGQLITNLNDT